MTTKTETLIKFLGTNHPNMTFAEIATLASVSPSEVRRVLQPKQPAMAPTYSPFAKTDAPVTAFEHRLKDAGKFATVYDAVESIREMKTLLTEAIALGDKGAEAAVVMRAMTLHFRAKGHKDKGVQAEAFLRFVAAATGMN